MENEQKTEYRYTRVLIYQGPREWIDECIKNRSVKECHQVTHNKVIYEASMMAIPEMGPISITDLLIWIENRKDSSMGGRDFDKGYLAALEQMSKYIRSL